MNNRGQISETMNWVIATIVIIVILTISFFIVKGDLLETEIGLPDKQKDFAATKSIVNFVGDNYNLVEESLKEDNYIEFDEKFKPFLESLFVEVCDDKGCAWNGGWNLRFEGKVLSGHQILLYKLGDKNLYYVDFFFLIENKEIKLRFWKSLGWINL